MQSGNKEYFFIHIFDIIVGVALARPANNIA